MLEAPREPEVGRQRRLIGREWLAAAVVLAAVVLGVSAVLYFWPWTSDDAFISFRYARNLAEGQGLTFNPGERVQGYSNFLMVLCLAIASRLSLDIATVAKLLGLIGFALTAVLASILAANLAGNRLAAVVTFLLCGTSIPLAFWAVSGMETVPYAALVLLGSILYIRYREGKASAVQVVMAFLLIALIRSEGAVFFGTTCMFHAAAKLLIPGERRVDRTEARALVAFGVVFGAYLIFLTAYFGSPIPNTAVAKTGHSEQLLDGVLYLVLFLPLGAVLAILGLLPFLTRRSVLGPKEGYLWWLCATWTVAVVLFGGDWMLLHRFFVPILPLLCALGGAGFARTWIGAGLGGSNGGVRRVLAVATLVAVALSGSAMSFQMVRPEVFPTYLSWDEAANEAGLWLAANAGKTAVVAVDDAGRVPFYSSLVTIDTAGLLTPSIARMPGRFEVKQGAGAYVLSRRPRYIEMNAFGSVRDGVFIPGGSHEQFFGNQEFLDHYRLAFYRDAWRAEPGTRFILVFERTSGSIP